MKEAKFRAWFIKGKFEPMDGQVCSTMGDLSLREFLQLIEDAAEEHGYNYILIEYTGLKDINDKEIYEGDVVKLTQDAANMCDGIGGEFEIGNYEVCWDSCYAAFAPFDEYQPNQCNIEVIGNIYENPELLEKMNE